MFVVPGTEWLANAELRISSAAQEHSLSDVPDLTLFNFLPWSIRVRKVPEGHRLQPIQFASFIDISVSEDF